MKPFQCRIVHHATLKSALQNSTTSAVFFYLAAQFCFLIRTVSFRFLPGETFCETFHLLSFPHRQIPPYELPQIILLSLLSSSFQIHQPAVATLQIDAVNLTTDSVTKQTNKQTKYCTFLSKKLIVSQEITCTLNKSKFLYHFHNSLPVISLLSNINPVYIQRSCFFNINFNIVVPSKPRSSRFSHQNRVCVSILSHTCHADRLCHLPSFCHPSSHW